MKLINKMSIFFLAIILLASCSKDEEEQTAQMDVCIDEVCIDGEWKWVQSYGSIAGSTITPQTEMETRSLIIDDFEYSQFVDGNLVLKTEYEYVKSDELNSFTTDSLVLKLVSGNWYAVFEEGSNLILMEPCADCWTHTYTRD